MKKALFIFVAFIAGFFSSQALYGQGQYCVPQYSLGGGGISVHAIENVTLGTIQTLNTGVFGSSPEYFSDYTHMSTDLEVRSTHMIQVKRHRNTYAGYIAVWIDYNQDGDFSDAGEKIAQSTSIDYGHYVSFNFTVPQEALAGPTRMRVRQAYSEPDMLACDNYLAGETEDYTVNIIPLLGISTDFESLTAMELVPYQRELRGSHGAAPYTWSLVGAPAWLNIDPSTGLLNGTPPAGTSGTDLTVDVKIDDSVGASYTEGYTLRIRSLGQLPYTEDFEGNIDAYEHFIGEDARFSMNPRGASSGAKGLTLDSQLGNTDWEITFVEADDPTLWAATDPGYLAIIERSLEAVGVSSFYVTFNLRILADQAASASYPWHSNLVFQWSDDNGQSWNIASGNGANAQGIYRDTNGFITTSFRVDNVDTTQAGGVLKVRFQWLTRWSFKDIFTTLVGIDDLRITTTQPTILTIGPPSIPDVFESVPFGPVQLQASGGVAPYTWAEATPNKGIWKWFDIDANTGEITGTVPAGTNGNTYELAASVQDSAGSAVTAKAYIVDVGKLDIVNNSRLPDATETQAYLDGSNNPVVLQATGGLAPYTWAVTLGSSLPQGVSLNPATGEISGTPAAGTSSPTGKNYALWIEVTDANNNSVSESFEYWVFPPAAFKITTALLPNAVLYDNYDQTLSVTGGTAPYTWTHISGILPFGVTLGANTGKLSGHVVDGSSSVFNFEVQVEDSTGATATHSYTVKRNLAALEITTTGMPDGQEGIFYSEKLVATNGTPSYSWSIVQGSLPQGLVLDALSGEISGTPALGAQGTASFKVQVQDSAGTTTTEDLNIQINSSGGGPALSVTTTALASGTENISYSAFVGASGGTAPYTWSIVQGSLPQGLTLNAATGEISGTPALGAQGTASFRVQVEDSTSATATQDLSLQVNASGSGPALSVTTTTLASGTENISYSAFVGASGGTAPYSWSIVQGSLPQGLSLNASTGEISGTPALGTQGATNFRVQVQDSASATATQDLSLQISVLSGGSSNGGGSGSALLSGSSGGGGCAFTKTSAFQFLFLLGLVGLWFFLFVSKLRKIEE